ncbi:MAG: folylpolyglutamate synthase/dihydrofolate synthase family protein [Bacteroidota bacterium]|nr:folylpolyglutamate synthase/dihydrofolate synthase family protein [Bacteroidota bacterium]
MTYQQTLDYLFSRLPMYQKEGEAAYKADIGNIVAASKKLGNPHKKFKSIHIAGTNGKGSVSHMLASILQEAGYKVGLYTSPHLKDFRERIKINGEMISEAEVLHFVTKNKIHFEKINLSFFEFTVALTFNYFANQKVDIAIIETGLGGRLDSTNIIAPELSIITNIGLDHTNLLGNTIEEIAKEKGGIIKQNTPIIIGRKQEKIKAIFQNIANEKSAFLKYATPHNYISDLKGNYQKENCNTAVSSILELQKQGWKITDENIMEGLLNTIKNTGLLGRWQILGENPLIICDTGHNEDGIKAIFRQIKQIPHKNLHAVFGVVNGKNLDTILNLLPKDAIYYFCKPNIARAMDAKEFKKKAYQYQLLGNSFSSVQKAVQEAKRKAKLNDLIFIGGSTFVVAEAV